MGNKPTAGQTNDSGQQNRTLRTPHRAVHEALHLESVCNERLSSAYRQDESSEEKSPEESWSWTIKQDKCYDPNDSTLTFVDGEDAHDFLFIGYKSRRAKMSCGHAVTPMSLTNWCRRQLDQGKYRYVCGQPNCDVEWPFKEVCKMALLTSEEIKEFEEKRFSNLSKHCLDVKACPGCKSLVKRADPTNLRVKCTVCTAAKGRRYVFCWQCLREWKGPLSQSDHCDNDDCPRPLELLRNCPDIIFSQVEGVTGCPSIRACPTCGLIVRHNSTGCKNITCFRCKVEFCFVCLKITTECQKLKPQTWYNVCLTGVAPRQTSIPVWQKSLESTKTT